MSPELPPRERVEALRARLVRASSFHMMKDVAREAIALASAMCGLAESACISRDKALDERNAARRGQAVALGRAEAAERERDRYETALREIATAGWIATKCWDIARRALDGERGVDLPVPWDPPDTTDRSGRVIERRALDGES